MTTPGTLGFRILSAPERLSRSLLDRFQSLASSTLADAMGRFGFMDPGIRPRSGRSLCGPAITVICRPGDNLMVHKALQVASAGDIVVVNTCGNVTSAVFGELMCETAVGARLGGLVVDGAIRDEEGITRLGFAAFSRTTCPGACDKDGPGEINVAVSCGGVAVHPGDIVVGDRDGVVVVPRADAEAVLEAAFAIVEREAARIAEIKAGGLFRPEIDQILRKKGVVG